MSKGSGVRPMNRQRYDASLDRIRTAVREPKCTCPPRELDGLDVALGDPPCVVHHQMAHDCHVQKHCDFCDGTGTRFNGESCNHRRLID